MSFSERAKLTALAIVHIFETSKPLGEYSAVAVLNDGAGVSYGINQFTHRSGSLFAVVNTYLGEGGKAGADILRAAMHTLRDRSRGAIQKLSNDNSFKNALRVAGRTAEMRLAQQQIAENFYLLPAIEACEGSGFVLPLSLAVVYDSINHGSWERIRDNVPAGLPEKQWITSYCRRRDAWLESVPRLAVTDYRTDFFLAQIARDNWNLNLPLNVHGYRLTEADIHADESSFEPADDNGIAGEPPAVPAVQDTAAEQPASVTVSDQGLEDISNTPVPADPAGDASASTAQPAPPVQNAENITNVQTGDKNVPDNFVAQNKSVPAPAAEGTTKSAATMTVAGFTVPAFMVGIITAIKSAMADGYISAQQIGDAVLGFVQNNTRYVFAGLGLVITGMFLKKLYKQVTLWLSMYFAARADMHNVTVKPQ